MKSTTMLPGGFVGVAAAGMWLCSRSAQLTVDTVDDRSGPATADLVGAIWAPELTSIALAMVAALSATTILGLTGRRIVGGLVVPFTIAASWIPMTLLVRGEEGVDPQRVPDSLTPGSATQRASDAATVAGWAQVLAIEMYMMGPALASLYCTLALVRVVLLVRRPDTVRKQKPSAYETLEIRRRCIAEDLEGDLQPGRVLWDVLDAGIDPIDLNKE